MSPRPAISLARPLLYRRFHASTPWRVKVGDYIPTAPLMEGSPGNKVDLAKEIGTRQAVIVGVPAAFSE
jgi:peroxiredoxin 5